MTHPDNSATSPELEPIDRQAWVALIVTTLAIFFVVVNVSSVNVAFPSIRDDFGVSDVQLSWVIGAYNICLLYTSPSPRDS